MKPSDFPRDIRFRTAGDAFIENGVAHLRNYADIKRVMLDEEAKEFTQDTSYWAPQNQRIHISWYFLWATGKRKADGSVGRHDLLRSIIEPYFRTKPVKEMALQIENDSKVLIRKIIEKGTGHFDLADEYAYLLSLRTICSMVGLPYEREKWMRAQLEIFTQTPDLEQVKREPQEVEDYFREVIHYRQKKPGNEAIDILIEAWQNEKITEIELMGYMWGLFQAGTDTTGTNIINALSLFGEFGLLDEARANIHNEEWLRRAGEEVLRFGTPFAAGPSLAIKDVTLDSGLHIPAMTMVRLWFSAANRDEYINGGNPNATSPEIFDIHRWPNQHMTFGLGMHYCVGSQLAKLETKIALQTLLHYLPNLQFDQTRPFVRFAGIVDGVKEAHFTFDQQKAEKLLDQLL
jgi:cytochrome P450